MIRATVPVGPREYSELAEELRRIGYNLRPIKRASWWHHEKRLQAAKRLLSSDTV